MHVGLINHCRDRLSSCPRCYKRTTLFLFFLLSIGSNGQGAVLVTATEITEGVSFSGTGTMDLSGATAGVGSNASAGVDINFYVLVGPPGGQRLDTYFPSEFNGPSRIGPGNYHTPQSGTGDLFGVSWGRGSLGVQEGYQSGSLLSGSMLFAGETFESIGLEQDTYVWTWKTGDAFDSYTLVIAPEPLSAVLLVTGWISLSSFRRRVQRGDIHRRE